MTTTKKEWVIIARIRQIDGGVRLVSVERQHAAEVRECLRQDPAMIDGLWCATRVRDIDGPRASRST